MQNLNPYQSYKELIRRGWFGRHIEDLESLLSLLEREGRITADQSRHLLQMAADQRAEEGARLQRAHSPVFPRPQDPPAAE
jgi:hypothetical protein